MCGRGHPLPTEMAVGFFKVLGVGSLQQQLHVEGWREWSVWGGGASQKPSSPPYMAPAVCSTSKQPHQQLSGMMAEKKGFRTTQASVYPLPFVEAVFHASGLKRGT